MTFSFGNRITYCRLQGTLKSVNTGSCFQHSQNNWVQVGTTTVGPGVLITGKCKVLKKAKKKTKNIARSEDRTHDLQIMRLTRCLLRYPLSRLVCQLVRGSI
ncbi:hypothetical protein L596_026421 [Steinernema carpocapsae]|uniref:Uncharacterized protein n=1 Tax=Steinernema carpocapsae TaxID=34508 RepID=A0A4V6XVP5_STECR|nr:hypothetical protein L596_026421 [Steinernema carpocapsae]